MWNKLLLCLACLCSLEAKEPMIKVLIAHDVSGVVLEAKGRYQIYDPHTKEFVVKRAQGKRKLIQPLKEGLKWGEAFPDLYQLVFVPDSEKTTFLVDGVEYQGNVYVYDIGG
ncbi:MAG: hypothetical protein KDK65_07465, partial [Chlamydiia bacterium]|nr:hypothetical protein [Chlamydiia bacterium]